MQARDIQALVMQTVKECTTLFKDKGWAPASWNARIKIDFGARRNRSWGGVRRGVPFISLALSRFVGTDVADFQEYRSFAHDREIGSIKGNTINAVRALVIHEMCHAIQYSGTNQMASSVGATGFGDRAGHGLLWKNLYRIARNTLMGKPVTIDTTNVAPVKTVKVEEPARNTIKRSEALQLIASWKRRGYANTDIIFKLIVEYGFKKTTATTYTYSV